MTMNLPRPRTRGPWRIFFFAVRRTDECRCLPHPAAMDAAKTILAIGQDLFSIDEYLKSQYNYSLHRYIHEKNSRRSQLVDGDNINGGNDDTTAYRRTKKIRRESDEAGAPTLRDVTPPVFMAYTDIQTLRGLDRPVDYGSGVEYADGIVQLIVVPRGGADVGLQLGLWLNGTEGCQDVVEHRLDSRIRRLVEYLSMAPFDRVWLRIGYEFDNPSFGYVDDPDSYRQAFRTIVTACRSEHRCRQRTRFVWHSWAASLTEADELMPFYPGDDVVDWIGISVFSQLYDPSDNDVVVPLGNQDNIRAVLEFARDRRKPTMIAESTPFGGIPAQSDPWEAWFRPVLDLISEHGIGMWCYINCDWESQPMWHQVGFGDTRLNSNGTVLRLWNEEVLRNPRFVSNIHGEHNGFLAPRTSLPLFAMHSRFSTLQLLPDRPDEPLLMFLSAVALAVGLAVFVSLRVRTRPSESGRRMHPRVSGGGDTRDTEGDYLNARGEREYGATH